MYAESAMGGVSSISGARPPRGQQRDAKRVTRPTGIAASQKVCSQLRCVYACVRGLTARDKELQKEMQERMRRTQISQQMAVMRERTWWFGGVTGALLVAAAATRRVSVALPAAPLTIMTAYHWDFGYGTKINRISAMHELRLVAPFCVVSCVRMCAGVAGGR